MPPKPRLRGGRQQPHVPGYDEDRMVAAVAMLRERLERSSGAPPEEGVVPDAVLSDGLFDKATKRRALHATRRDVAPVRPATAARRATVLRATLPAPFGASTPVDNPKVNVQMVLRK